MKNILFFAIVACLVACAPSTTYTITGEVAGNNDGKEVYLKSIGSGKVIDTAIIVGGKFMFEGDALCADIAEISVNRRKTEFVLEPGVIVVSIDEKGEGEVSGTVLNTVMNDFSKETKAIYDQFGGVMDSLKAIYKDDESKIVGEYNAIYYGELKPKLDTLFAKTQQENSDNILGVKIYSKFIANDMTVEEINAYLEQIPMAKDYAPLNKALGIKVMQEKTSAGKMFTDFSARNIENTKDIKLSDYVGKGNYVLLDFWASWCSPCRAGMPHLAELYKKYAKKGFVVLSINVWDDHDKALTAIKNLKMNWAQIYVPGRERGVGVPKLYGVNGIPTLILFAPDGKIVHRSHNGSEFDKYIEKAYDE